MTRHLAATALIAAALIAVPSASSAPPPTTTQNAKLAAQIVALKQQIVLLKAHVSNLQIGTGTRDPDPLLKKLESLVQTTGLDPLFQNILVPFTTYLNVMKGGAIKAMTETGTGGYAAVKIYCYDCSPLPPFPRTRR